MHCQSYCDIWIGYSNAINCTSKLRYAQQTSEACATRLCSHTFSVGLISEPREGWRRHRCWLRARRIGWRQHLLPCAWKSLITVACLVFPFLLWPTLLTCSGRASVTASQASPSSKCNAITRFCDFELKC